VIFALALVTVIAMTGLLIDGSALFAQQRVAQNGADAAATAGGLVIADGLDTQTTRTNRQVYDAIEAIAATNGLLAWSAEYTNAIGTLLGQPVQANDGPIPPMARGVRVSGDRELGASFLRVIGINTLTASAAATVLAGPTSTDCVTSQDGCTLLPLTFPVKISQCDAKGELEGGTWIGAPPPDQEDEEYWPIVGMESLPSTSNPNGDLSKLAILPLCKGSGTSTGAFGWLDLDPNIPNLSGEIKGPIAGPVNIPNWFQAQTGNPNSVEDELEAYIHKPVLIPLHNQACRVDPGATDVCPDSKKGVDSNPNGNNTWYYVHTLAVFYPHQILVQGKDVDACASPPGSPLVPVTNGAGFLGCIKGWFVKYVISGPINPDGSVEQGAIGIQLIH